MDYINEFVDERMKGGCVYCGGLLAHDDTSSDHVPSKCLLQKPYPENLPTVETCVACNNSFSADEEYLFLFLNCVLSGSTDPDIQTNTKVGRALLRHNKLRERIERSKNVQALGGDMRVIWGPETDRIKRVIVKNAQGHALYEYGERMETEPEHVWMAPLETMTEVEIKNFENMETIGIIAGWPEVGSRMMTHISTGQNMRNSWIIVQDGVYRYRAEQHGVTYIRSVLFEYLATEVFWNV